MALIDSSVINLVVNAKETGVDGTRRKIEDVIDSLRQAAAANIAASEATDANARSQTKLASSSGTATSGLAGLQAQLASTAATQRAFEDSTNDVRDVLDDTIDTQSGYSQAVEAMVEGLADAGDELDEIGDFDADLLENFDESELRSFVKLVGGASDEMRKLRESQEAFISTDQHSEFRSQLYGILGAGEGENFRKAFTEGFPKDAPIDPTEYDLASEAPIHPINMRQLMQRDDVDTMRDVLELDDADIADTLKTTIGSSRQVDDSFGGDAVGIPFDIIPKEIQQDFIRGNVGSVGQAFTLTDQELGQIIAEDFETQPDMTEETPDRELRERASEIKTALFNDIRERSEEFQDSQLLSVLHDDPPPGTEFPPEDMVRERREGADESNVSEALNRARSFLEGQNKYTYEERDRHIAEPVSDLEDLATDNKGLEQILEESDNVNEALAMLGDEPSTMRQFLEAAESGELAGEFGDLSRFVDNIDEVTSVEDLQETVSRMIGVDPPGTPPSEQQSKLSGLRREVYTNAVSDMQRFLPGSQQGDDIPVAQETLELEFIQELLESDSPERRNAVRELLEDLYADNLGQMGTLFGNEELMRDQFGPGLRSTLPDDFGEAQADYIESQFGEQNRPLTYYLGQESAGNVSEIVDAAITDTDFDGDRDRAIQRGTNAVRQALRETLLRVGSQAAPGFFAALEESEYDIEDIVPDAEAVTPGDPQDNRMAPPQSPVDIAERKEAIDEQIENVEEVTDDLSELQKREFLRLGFTGEGLFGEPNRRRGVYGLFLQNAPKVLATADSLRKKLRGVPFIGDSGGSTMQPRSGEQVEFNFDTPRNMQRLVRGGRNLRESFAKLNPIFDVTSANLGALNVAFESLGRMAYKFTATLGPLITALIGLAGAAVTAGAALASFAAVGAVGFLEQMESQMAGVSNKQEALEQLGQTLRDMAMQAVAPLSNARLADGTSGIQFVVDIIRGGLRLLNRFSRVMAEIVSMPVVTEQLDRLATLFLEGDNSDLIENLEVAMREGLPVVVDVIVGLVTALDDLIAYGARLADLFGGNLGPALGNLQSALAILVALGAGFINIFLILINVIGSLVSVLTEAINLLLAPTGVVGDFFGMDAVTVTDLAFAVGTLIGAFVALQKVVAVLLQRIGLLSSRLFVLTGVLFVLYDTYQLLFGEQKTFAARITENMGLIQSAAVYFAVYAAQLAIVAGAVVKLLPLLTALKAKILAVNAALLMSTGYGFAGWLSAIGGLLLKGAAAAYGLVGGLISLKAGAIGAIIAVVAILADFVYYLITGESKLHDLLDGLADFTGRDFFSGLADDLIFIYDILEDIIGMLEVIRPEDRLSPYREAGNAFESDGRIQTQPYAPTGNTGGSSSRAQTMRQQAASAAGTVINIYADGSRSDRDLARRIRSELNTFFTRELLG